MSCIYFLFLNRSLVEWTSRSILRLSWLYVEMAGGRRRSTAKGRRGHVAHFSEAPAPHHNCVRLTTGSPQRRFDSTTQRQQTTTRPDRLRISSIQDAYLRRYLQRPEDLPWQGASIFQLPRSMTPPDNAASIARTPNRCF